MYHVCPDAPSENMSKSMSVTMSETMSETMSGTMSKPESVVGGQTPQLTTPLAAQQIHSSAAVQRENEVGIPHEDPSPSLASSLQPQPGAEGCFCPPRPECPPPP